LSSGFIAASYIYPIYVLPFEIISETSASDNLPFWQKGYKALFAIERTFNTYYHTRQETYDKLRLSFMTNIVKASVAALGSWVTGRYLSIVHNPVAAGSDTAAKTLIFKVQCPLKLGTGANAPRLYYKINNGSFTFINPCYTGNDTMKFIIPGQPFGTYVTYYFAVQDSAGSVCITLPYSRSSVNPPGVTLPKKFFTYEIYTNLSQCSNTLPKPILDRQYTYDTIRISQDAKLVNKLNVNLTLYHPNDGDLYIQLRGPNGLINLSQGNGTGGANYINTTFDDSASLSITEGTPPYTGSFRPQSPLSFFKNQPASANWVLRIYDLKDGNEGTLASWCLIFRLSNLVSTGENTVPVKYELSQNYPNPFNPYTRIPYKIAENTFVTLKVYDVLGREVKTLVSGKQTAGEYVAVFNSSGLTTGVYFYRLQAGEFTETKRMLMIK
jgi:subtilisin-like proprotein convertase family protein